MPDWDVTRVLLVLLSIVALTPMVQNQYAATPGTTPPSTSALKAADECSKSLASQKMDIFFIVDSSSSIHERNFTKMLEFVASIIEKVTVSPNDAHIGLLQYNSQERLEFSLNTYQSKADVLNHVKNVRYLTGVTYTGKAIRTVLNTEFVQAKGYRPDVPNIIIVLTDGLAQDDVLTPSNRARDQGIAMFAIGITFEVGQRQLLEITGYRRDRVFLLDDFESFKDILNSLEHELEKSVAEECRNGHGYGNGITTAGSYGSPWSSSPTPVTSSAAVYGQPPGVTPGPPSSHPVPEPEPEPGYGVTPWGTNGTGNDTGRGRPYGGGVNLGQGYKNQTGRPICCDHYTGVEAASSGSAGGSGGGYGGQPVTTPSPSTLGGERSTTQGSGDQGGYGQNPISTQASGGNGGYRTYDPYKENGGYGSGGPDGSGPGQNPVPTQASGGYGQGNGGFQYRTYDPYKENGGYGPRGPNDNSGSNGGGYGQNPSGVTSPVGSGYGAGISTKESSPPSTTAPSSSTSTSPSTSSSRSSTGATTSTSTSISNIASSPSARPNTTPQQSGTTTPQSGYGVTPWGNNGAGNGSSTSGAAGGGGAGYGPGPGGYAGSATPASSSSLPGGYGSTGSSNGDDGPYALRSSSPSTTQRSTAPNYGGGSGDNSGNNNQPYGGGDVASSRSPGYTGNTGHDGNVEIRCDDGRIQLALSNPPGRPFSGWAFIKGHFDEPSCRFDFQNNTDQHIFILLRYDRCGLLRQRSSNPAGISFSTIIIFMKHRQFITDGDRAYRLQCFYMEAEKTVTQSLDVSMLTTQSIEATAEMPACQYTLREGRLQGPPVKTAIVGMKVVHRWDCEAGMNAADVYGIKVHTCYVRNNQGKKVLMLDEAGCAVDKYVLDNLKYTDDLMTAYVESSVFKFADSDQVFFDCQISVCVKVGGGCQGVSPPNCTTPTRGKRSPTDLAQQLDTDSPQYNFDLVGETVFVIDSLLDGLGPVNDSNEIGHIGIVLRRRSDEIASSMDSLRSPVSAALRRELFGSEGDICLTRFSFLFGAISLLSATSMACLSCIILLCLHYARLRRKL